MKQLLRRGAALGLALLMTAGAATAGASDALGWEIHRGRVPLSQGTGFEKTLFWSDTYADLRAEYYIEYTPNPSVVPTVAYGERILAKATLTSMAEGLESLGKHVVSGINGDWYVVSTGAPTGLVLTGGVVRSTPYYNTAWAVGFNSDGTAFIGRPGLNISVSFGGQAHRLGGGINKIRKLVSGDTSGGLTLLTSDFSAMTQNTQPGVDVILTPMDDGTGYSLEPRIGSMTRYVVEQVLESEGSIPIPEGKAVLTLNSSDNAEILEELRALQPGDPVVLTIGTADLRWTGVDQALGGVDKIVTAGQVENGLPSDRTACTAVGVRSDGSVVLYTLDGRQSGYSVGATMTQVAQRLVELGCVDAISMDGGGSTNLGVTWPGQSSLQIVGRPSDGSQRANSTAIFLTTRMEPTGNLSSYYVTPTDAMLLAGSTLQLSAAGLDSAFYPTSGGYVDWSVPEGGGSINSGGLFTAGSESGFSVVSASDGWGNGSAYITTVKTPDSISVLNEATGAAVSALNLDPGEQLDLTASAVYRKLALVAQDTSFVWSTDVPGSSVDANGVFTAGEEGASGSLTVSAGGASATVPVRVASHVYPLDVCEGFPAFTGAAPTLVEAETNLDFVRSGRQSWRVSYDLSAGSALLSGVLSIAGGERYLGLWIYGDGSGNVLEAATVNTALQEQYFTLAVLDFTGWKHISVPLPENSVSLTGLQILPPAESALPDGGLPERQSGVIWLDQFTTSNEEIHDFTPPTVSVTISGRQLTASVSDNVDRSFTRGQLTLSYDGMPLDFQWDEAAGVLTAALPEAGAACHRVSVTATDASGNLGRGSAGIAPPEGRESVFSDMADSPYRLQATHLYDTAVTNGVPTVDGLAFQPDKHITRAEFFALVARWLNLDLGLYAGVELPFADTSSVPEWALREVKAMYSLGLLKGADAGGQLLVNAGTTITRAEALTILGRTQPMGSNCGAFTAPDAVQVPTWAALYAQNLWVQGVVGANGSNIRPQDLLTRGEMADMLYAMR